MQFPIALHPSRGMAGSVFMTHDRTTYVRTPSGNRKVAPEIGLPLVMAQHVHETLHRARRKLMLAALAAGFIVGLGLGLLTRF